MNLMKRIVCMYVSYPTVYIPPFLFNIDYTEWMEVSDSRCRTAYIYIYLHCTVLCKLLRGPVA